MHYSPSALLLAVLLTLPALASPTDPSADVGASVARITAIRGVVLWRAKGRGRQYRLDPKRDQSRILHSGDTIRVRDVGSAVAIKLDRRLVHVTGPSTWYSIPYSQADRMRALAAVARRGGRERKPAVVVEIPSDPVPLGDLLAKYGDCRLAVCSSAVDALPALAALPLAVPSSVQLVSDTDPWDVRILPADGCRNDSARVSMYRRDGSLIYLRRDDKSETSVFQGSELDLTIGDVLTAECLRKGVLSLATRATEPAKVSARILDAQWDRQAGRVEQVLGPHQRVDEQGTLIFDDGDAFMLEMSNIGAGDCRTIVLAIDDCANLNVLWPAPGWQKANETVTLPADGKPVVLGRDTCRTWDGIQGTALLGADRTTETLKIITYSPLPAGPNRAEGGTANWSAISIPYRVLPKP